MIDKEKKYLAIDWGEKRLGLAVGQLEPNLAVPLKTVANLSEVLAVIIEEEVDEIVLGQPISMSGKENFSDNFLYFKKLLTEKANIPIHLVDERLSSKAADKLLISKKLGVRDELAAMVILETFLNLND